MFKDVLKKNWETIKVETNTHKNISICINPKSLLPSFESSHFPLLSFQKLQINRMIQLLSLEVMRTPGVGGFLTSRLGVSTLSSSVKKAWGLTRAWQLWEKLWRTRVHLMASWASARGLLSSPCCAQFRSKNWSRRSTFALPSSSPVSAAHVRNTRSFTTLPSRCPPCMCLDWRTEWSLIRWAGSSSPPSKTLRSSFILVVILFLPHLLTGRRTRTSSRGSSEIHSHRKSMWRLTEVDSNYKMWLVDFFLMFRNILWENNWFQMHTVYLNYSALCFALWAKQQPYCNPQWKFIALIKMKLCLCICLRCALIHQHWKS